MTNRHRPRFRGGFYSFWARKSGPEAALPPPRECMHCVSYSMTTAGAGLFWRNASTGVLAEPPFTFASASGQSAANSRTRSASTRSGESSGLDGSKRRSLCAMRLRSFSMASSERSSSARFVPLGQALYRPVRRITASRLRSERCTQNPSVSEATRDPEVNPERRRATASSMIFLLMRLTSS